MTTTGGPESGVPESGLESDPAISAGGGSRVRTLLRGSAGIAIAMAVMNVATYVFQMVAARVLGPAEYGAVAALMALLLVLAVLQLGLQATAARRIAATPANVAQIERVIMGVTYRAAFVLGAVMLVASPLVWKLLKLDGIAPAILLALCAVPLTIMGGQAGILQGERRWVPLALLYLGIGVPRVAFGSFCILIEPSETSAMIGVLIGLFVPAITGWFALRPDRSPGTDSDDHQRSPMVRELAVNSLALLAFYVLTNLDIVMARNVLDSHDAGLYAGGLILTKALLFLPQFVVVVAFPSMSTLAERRSTLVRSLGLVALLGVLGTLGATLLSGVTMVFIGGSDYAEVESKLWLFAVLGTVLSMLQLLVYSVLARRGTRSAYVVWLGVIALVVAASSTSTLGSLVLAVTLVDAVLFVVLLGLTIWRIWAPDESHPESPQESPGTLSQEQTATQ